MDPPTLNVLLTSFGGLGLPPTLCLARPSTTSIDALIQEIETLIPQNIERFSLTTTSNKELRSRESHIATLASPQNGILPLRLSVPLCGGKGGFGSQLRAAGGRMSSKRKKDQSTANSSNRNLDGRRLRTINEAKALAEYLALKPEMEKKEKEARWKRWEQVVEMAERREEEVRNGTKGRVDGKWVEDKEEAGERAREAARAAVLSGLYRDNLRSPSDKSSEDQEEVSEDDADENPESESDSSEPKRTGHTSTSKTIAPTLRAFSGFDDDDEFMSDSDDSDMDGTGQAQDGPSGKGKGKSKV